MRVKPIVEDGVVRISLPHMKTSHATCYQMLSPEAAQHYARQILNAADQVIEYNDMAKKKPYSKPEIKSTRKFDTIEEANAALDDYLQEMKALPEAVKRRAEELALEEERRFSKAMFGEDGKEIKPMPLPPEGTYKFTMPKSKVNVDISMKDIVKMIGDGPDRLRSLRMQTKTENKSNMVSTSANPVPEIA